MEILSDYLAHCKRGEKIHLGSQITIRVTHIHSKLVHIRICAPLEVRHVCEKNKPRKPALGQD